MTDHGVAGELPASERVRAEDGRGSSDRLRRSAALSLNEVLSLCDRHLNEVGRRNHLFGWLRPPGAGADSWLPVDAYYPRNRLVVLYRPRARAHDQVYRELIPGHGLRLLVLAPDELGNTAAGAERALAALLVRLDPTPPAGPPPVPAEPDLWKKVSSRATAALHTATAAAPRKTATAPRQTPRPAVARPSAAERAERFLTTRGAHGTRRARQPKSAESPLAGIAVGLTLFIFLLVAVLYIASTSG